MKLRGKLLWPILGLLGLAGLSFFGLLEITLTRMVDHQAEQTRHLASDYLQRNIQDRASFFDHNIEQISHTAMKQAAMICNDPQVIDAYHLALTGHIDEPTDSTVQQARVKLRSSMAPMLAGYLKQSESSILKVHFHLPNTHSLVRLWRKGWNAKVDGKKVDISDDLTDFRQSITQVNTSDHKPVCGIEIGRGGFAIRGIVPITDPKGQHLGSVEVLYPFSDATNQMAKRAKDGLAVYMKAQYLDIATSLRDPARFPVVYGKFVQCAISNNKQLHSAVTSDLLENGSKQLTLNHVGDFTAAAWPIRDYNNQVVGVMAMGTNTKEQQAALAQVQSYGKDQRQKIVRAMGLGLLVMGLILAVTFISVLRQFVLKPINNLVLQLDAMSKGDLSQRVPDQQRDELGSLGRRFNHFIEQFSRIILAVSNSAHEVADAASQIDCSSQEMATGIEQQTEQITQISAAITQMNASAVNVAEHSATAAQQAQESGHVARDGGDVVQQNIKSIHAINQTVAQSSQAVQELGKCGEQIGQIIMVINDIADQTNLLALNAAIEAARAGEHGRGFAVVADEVRKLADRTTHATEEVSESIRAIQTETELAVDRMQSGTEQVNHGVACANKAVESLDQILDKTQSVTQMIQTIADASREQSAASEQVSRNVESIIGVVRQSSEGAGQTASAATQLSTKAQHLQNMVRQFKLASDVQDMQLIDDIHEASA